MNLLPSHLEKDLRAARTEFLSRLPVRPIPFGAMHSATFSRWQHRLEPLDQWRAYITRECANMRDAGLNMISAHLDWCDIEPRKGGFSFDRHDALVEAAAAAGLKVFLWPWSELQPRWVLQEHPDAQWRSADGNSGGSACWDCPPVRSAIMNFMDKAMEHYGRDDRVSVFDLAAEAAIWPAWIGNPIDDPNSHPREYCYCRHTIARFRRWLQGRYQALEQLNYVWADYYQAWDEIEPVRVGMFERANARWLDWRCFMSENTAEFHASKFAHVRRAKLTDKPLVAHFGTPGVNYSTGAGDEQTIARQADLIGLSFFPDCWRHWVKNDHPAMLSFLLGMVRSMAYPKPFWVAELQGGPVVSFLTYRPATPSANDLQVWTWQAISHGAAGIFYWSWKPTTTGTEATGFGLTDLAGMPTPRLREVAKISNWLREHEQMVASWVPERADAGILFCTRTTIQCAGENNESLYARSIRGAYRALWENQVPVDIATFDLLAGQPLDRYRVLILPMLYTLSSQDARWIRQYIEAGGVVIADGWCGLRDDTACIGSHIPGQGLHEVFGCHEIQSDPAAERILRFDKEFSDALKIGPELAAHEYGMKLAATTARAVATFDDGSAAVTHNRFGRGHAYYVGTRLTHACDMPDLKAARSVLASLTLSAGVRRPAEVEHDSAHNEVEVRTLHTPDGGLALVAINHAKAPATIRVRLQTQATISESGLLRRTPRQTIPGDTAAFSCTLEARSVELFLASGR